MISGDLLLKCYSSAPSVDELKQYASDCSLNLDGALEKISMEVAVGFLSGVYTWDFGNCVMNNLYTGAYVLTDTCMPAVAYDIFAAFDAGEYSAGLEVGHVEGEERTKVLLIELLSSRAA